MSGGFRRSVSSCHRVVLENGMRVCVDRGHLDGLDLIAPGGTLCMPR